MFQNQVLHYSGNQTDKIFRLFYKNNATYSTDKLVHEKLVVTGKTAVLENKLIHYSYTSYKKYKEKTIRYGKFKALEKFSKKQKSSKILKYLHPTYNFLFNYILRLGFLDGKKGLIICFLNANSIRARYQELEQLWNIKNCLPPKQ